MKPYNLEVGWSADDLHAASNALKACKEINPENPIAAAEAMPEMFRLLLAAVVDAQKICNKGRLDPKEWLEKAHAAIDKAMSEK